MNSPENVDAFEDLDVEAISSGMSIAWSTDNVIERPGIARWMTELPRELSEGCHLALVTRGGDNRLPHPDDRIERGDHLTFIGGKEAVRQALDYCES